MGQTYTFILKIYICYLKFKFKRAFGILSGNPIYYLYVTCLYSDLLFFLLLSLGSITKKLEKKKKKTCIPK